MFKKDLKTYFYIIKDGSIIGRCLGYQTATRLALIHGAAFCCIYEDLVELPDDWLYELYKHYVGPLPPEPMVVEEMARDLWATFLTATHNYLRKPSGRDIIRAMYDRRTTYTKQEILEMVPDAQWSSVRVYLSQLKQEGLNVKYIEGRYVRQ